MNFASASFAKGMLAVAAGLAAVAMPASTEAAVVEFVFAVYEEPTTPGGDQHAFDFYIQLNPDQFTGDHRGLKAIGFNASGAGNKNIDSFTWNSDLASAGYNSLAITSIPASNLLVVNADMSAASAQTFNLGLIDFTSGSVSFPAGEPILYGSGVYTPTTARPLPFINTTTATLWSAAGDFGFATGVTREVVYTTVPEPASLGIATAVGLGLLARRRRIA